MQRKVQLRTDSPAQYFFNFEGDASQNLDCPFISSTIKEAGVTEMIKLVTIPIAKN